MNGVEYVGKEHAQHLMSALKENYEVSEDWTGSSYCDLTVKWDYKEKKVHLYMPGYIEKELEGFHHTKPSKPQNSPHPHVPPKYGQKQQCVEERENSTKVEKEE